MAARDRIEVKRVSWREHGATLTSIRRAVFVEEQNVPVELEIDGKDPFCDHVLAVAHGGEAIGTGRLLPDGHIGRMAVLAPWRRSGVGTALLRALIDLSRARGDHTVVLNAQTYVLGFYQREGFVGTGEEFQEAGIAHVQMRKSLLP